MVSHDLQRSTVTNQTALDRPDLQSAPEFKRTEDCRCQELASKLETLHTTTFYLTECNISTSQGRRCKVLRLLSKAALL